jgi:flagellar hook assembly protein FlgD
VDLAIYSVDGRRVRSLMHGIQEAGQYQVLWNGTDEHGNLVHSGTFYLRLDTAGNTYSKVVTLVR